jgi:GTP-binding protein EngB required for normal cell division
MFNSQKYRDKLSFLKSNLVEIVPQSELNNFSQHIENKLANFNPTLMVYGTYNAGKSTLLNAIFGKDEMAKTGDAPETYKVSAYDYNGFTIYDTPGINAPVEHEKVSREHLQKSEMVLFVVSNDGSFEEEYVYNEIVQIVKAKKPILVVLNNKKGIEHDSEDAIAEMNKVNENLSKIGDRHGIEQIETKVEIAIVNAKRALQGKIKNKNLLIDKSSILELEDKIKRMLQTAGSLEVENALDLYIRNFINRALEIIDSKIDVKELRKVEELLTYLNTSKKSSEVELTNIVNSGFANLQNSAIDTFQNGGDINRVLEHKTYEISSEVNISLQRIQMDLREKVELFTVEFKEIILKSEQVYLNELQIIEDVDSQNSDTQSGKIVLPPIPPIPAIPPVVTVILNAVVTIVNLFLGSKNERENAEEKARQVIDAKRNRLMSVKNQVDVTIQKTRNNAIDSISDHLNEIFDNLIQSYENISNKLNRDNTNLTELKLKLKLQN